MDGTRFDSISRFFAARRLSRRGAIGYGAGLAATLGLGTTAAQEATPVATPEPATAQKIPFLFVQSYRAGSVVPRDGSPGRFTVTLEDGLGQTIYFSDRPERQVGATPTGDFLQGLGFPDDNPPNAALVIETSPGVTEIAVVELFSPAYDESTHTVTYEVAVLADWENSTEFGLIATPADLATAAPSFGPAHLFIDDCPDLNISCQGPSPLGGGTEDDGDFGSQPMCWNYSLCMPCEPYGHTQPDRCSTATYWSNKCNQQFGTFCQGSCTASIDWPFASAVCF